MPSILVAFASREGQTEKISRHIAMRLQGHGHAVRLLDLADAPRADVGEACDAVIVAGSIHLGRHAPPISSFIMRHAPLLRSVPTAFLCVSLSAASKDPADLAAVDEITKRFLYEAGWQPDAVEHVAGAARNSTLGLFDRFTVQAVMMEKEIPTDPSGETELTDWSRLDRFIREFAGRVAGG